MDWHVFAKELAHMQCSPAGPLMDIKLTSGELEEIHLPHFLCLRANEATVHNAVSVLHGHDSGVCMEVCELTRHHTRLLQPSLSLLGVVWRRVSEYLFSPHVHCELLLFCTSAAPSLTLHVYLVPKDSAHIQAIHQKERPRGVWIDKPGTVAPLQLDASVRMSTLCQSEILPKEMKLWPLSTSNYSEVYIEDPVASFDADFKLVVISPPENGEPIWEAKIRRVDYQQCPQQQPSRTPVDPQQPSRIPGQVSSWMAAAFLDKTRPELIQRVTEVMPIADQLFSQRVIGQETYANIQAAATSQDKMRLLFEGLRSAGPQGKLAFYRILQEQQRNLVAELWTAS
ncbi:NACHT, LRR and PYD domains-containing protein 1 homolog [Engraulis encrasicolus]|uniref:NACHT, LRR and PYD domains-containing protein 1 homolog n=1 Tax=Engraulis encrasicolus TaxID=184585 RepID=UPI002FD79525